MGLCLRSLQAIVASSLLWLRPSLSLLTHRRFNIPLPSRLSMLRPIPVEISSTDSAPPVMPDLLLPNVEVQSLDGGGFLGVLLWTYVLYNGLFGLAGRPADWTLPPLARLFKLESEEWYSNYQSGYDYFVPPALEALRVGFFGILGYLLNMGIIRSFDGDAFWGWSIGLCLTIPSSLINLSRDKRLSREQSEFQVHMRLLVLIFLWHLFRIV